MTNCDVVVAIPWLPQATPLDAKSTVVVAMFVLAGCTCLLSKRKLTQNLS